MPISDSELIRQVRAGTGRSYARLVERHKDRAFSLALRLLKNRQDAEEALQDAFVRAYNALDRFEETAKFSTWFYRILYNVCLSRIGKRDLPTDAYDDEREYVIAPRTEIESRDLLAFVRSTIESLPEKYAA